LIRRLLLTIPTLFIASIIVFLSVRFIPGDVVDVMMMRSQSGISEETRAAIRRDLGLDTPIHIQYGRWLGVFPQTDAPSGGGFGKARFDGVLQGNVGTSMWTGVPVLESLKRRLPVTVELSLMGLVLGLLIAMPIGMYSALRQDTLGDYIARSIAMAFIAVPYFWIGILVVVFGSMWFRYMPPLRLVPFVEDPVGNLGQFIVPAITLGMVLSGWTMRLTRTMMLEVLRQDYVRTAWAKGLRERAVVVRHALKNSLIPVVSLVGLQLPLLFGGTVVIEQIFLLPGVGRYTVEATTSRDYPVISGVLLLFGGTVVLANLLIDLSYGFLDPRIRYE
jgi:peptide/nickel transport system permease protein